LLHPSPNCTYRIDYLVGDRAKAIPHATNPLPYDAGRAAFKKVYLTPMATQSAPLMASQTAPPRSP
jgi:hypothetical protein